MYPIPSHLKSKSYEYICMCCDTLLEKICEEVTEKRNHYHQTEKDLSYLQIISPQLSSEQNVFGFYGFKMIHNEPEVKSRKSKQRNDLNI